MICPNTLVASITGIAVALSEGHSSDDIALMGAAFSQLGDTLTTISIAKERCEKEEKDKISENCSSKHKK
ncbi:MAG: hypothetical protein Q8876_00230 [Bacillota bacterium]|nr:hypothetical protein [Bacillota bacterium]